MASQPGMEDTASHLLHRLVPLTSIGTAVALEPSTGPDIVVDLTVPPGDTPGWQLIVSTGPVAPCTASSQQEA